MAAGADHFLLVPKALPQIAEICHEYDLVGEPLPGADILQGVQGGNIALQGIIRQARQALQLAHTRHPQQQEGSINAFSAPKLDLLQPAGGQLGRAALFIEPGDLRQTADTLDHTGHADAAGPAAGNDLGEIIAKLVPPDHQAGELSIHDLTSIIHRYFYYNIAGERIPLFFSGGPVKRGKNINHFTKEQVSKFIFLGEATKFASDG